MKKRLLAALIALTALTQASAASALSGFDNFVSSGGYATGRFDDVKDDDWFAGYVEAAVNLGLASGKGGAVFDPNGMLTYGEALKLVMRLRNIYLGLDEEFTEGTPFYTVYAEYAIENGIITPGGRYTENATRAKFAELIYKALPEDAFGAINGVFDYGICDVTPDDGYGEAVYALYRAGITGGSDRYGTFYPDSTITRAEACAIMTRLARPDMRISVRLPLSIPADQIFEKSSEAVFMLEVFDSRGDLIRNGSGFFISETGLAVTNQHVVEYASSAIITLDDGSKYPVEGVCAISAEYDLAVIQIDSDGITHKSLKLADSDLIETGEVIYALSSPLGFLNSMTEGVVSNTSRVVEERQFFQFSAPISFGSGGGPVLNGLGQVIGVACSSFVYGQNLNLAVPVNLVKSLETGKCVSFDSLLQQ